MKLVNLLSEGAGLIDIESEIDSEFLYELYNDINHISENVKGNFLLLTF